MLALLHVVLLLISLSCLIWTVHPAKHEKQYHGHSALIPLPSLNCDIIKFRTLDDPCGRRGEEKHPVKGSCTKFIYCYQDFEGNWIPVDDECKGGKVFLPQWNKCGVSRTPDTCLQIECDNKRVRKQKPPIPVCEDEQTEEEEELEFGPIPKACTPKKVGNDPPPPNWDRQSSTSSTKNQPSNMNGYNPVSSSGYGNREAGRPQSEGGYFGNREAGREPQNWNSQNNYGNDFQNNQHEGPKITTENDWTTKRNPWRVDRYTTTTTSTRKPKYGEGDLDKNKNDYPPFPGQDYTSTQKTTTKKITFPTDQEDEEYVKNDHKGVPEFGQSTKRPDIGQEEDPFNDVPIHESQHQNNGKGMSVSVVLMILTFMALHVFN